MHTTIPSHTSTLFSGAGFTKVEGKSVLWDPNVLSGMVLWRKSVEAGEVVLPATTGSETVMSIFLRKREFVLGEGVTGAALIF